MYIFLLIYIQFRQII